MARLNELYEQEVTELIETVEKCARTLNASQSLDSLADVTLQEAKDALDSLDDSIKTLQAESTGNAEAKARASDYKKKAVALRREIDAAGTRLKRAALVGPGSGVAEAVDEDDHKGRIMAVNSRVDQQDDKIVEAMRIAQDTTEIGMHITETLADQRAVMNGIDGTVHETNIEVSSARAIVTRLRKKMVHNKLLLWGMIGALTTMIVIIIVVQIA